MIAARARSRGRQILSNFMNCFLGVMGPSGQSATADAAGSSGCRSVCSDVVLMS
jgi:hypothetical protein